MSDYSASPYKSSAELEREVEAQRHRVTNTIDEIQGRLSPGQIVDQLIGYTRTNSGEFAQNLSRSVKANPLPVALMGVGLLWLMTGAGNQHDKAQRPTAGDGEGLVGKAKHLSEDVSSSVAGTVGGIAGTVGDAADTVTHATQDVMGQAQQQARQLTHMVEEQPLISGALAFAVGAAIGAALPHTREEDALMGDIADSVKEEAADLFAEGKEAVEESYAEIKEQVGSAMDKPEQQPGHYAT